MSEKNYIAALEISSAKVAVVVGELHEGGHLEIVAAEQEKSVEGVRYGHILNLEDTSFRVARIIDRIERRHHIAPRKLTGVYIGLNGRSLKSITTTVSLTLPEDTEITTEIIDRLKEEALKTAIDSSLETVDAVPRIYTIGNTKTSSPKGVIGNRISAEFDLIVCRPELKRNIRRTVPEKLKIKDHGYIVTALASGYLLLNDDEKRLGCMLVDMGAETTTVTIYREGYLRYFATLPLGGRNITRDLTTLSLLEERAEDIKTSSGNAIAKTNQANVNVNGVKLSEVNNLIIARSEEMTANIVEQISYAGLKEKDLPAGIIVMGGASNLNGMTELLSRQTGMNVRKAYLPTYVTFSEAATLPSEMLEVASVLYAAATLGKDAEKCLEQPIPDELPADGEPNDPDQPVQDTRKRPEKKERKGVLGRWKNKFTDTLGNIFSNPEEQDQDSDLY